CLSACQTGLNYVMRGDEVIGLVRAFLYAGSRSVMLSLWTVDEVSTRLLMEMFYQELMTLETYKVTASTALALSRAQAYLRNMTAQDIMQALRARDMSISQIEQYLTTLAHMHAGHGSYAQHDALFSHPFYWAGFYLVGEKFFKVQNS
nr:CHAT domain-containing protein [Candidatus Saccharibacteria bacterium]